MPRANSTANDFDPNALTQKTDEHTLALEALQKRVGTNENFGKTLKAAAADSKSIDEAVEKIVIKLLDSNTKAQGAVENIVKKIDGRETKKQLWGLGKIVLWIITVVVAAIVGAFINSKFK